MNFVLPCLVPEVFPENFPLDCKTVRIFCVSKYARAVKQKVYGRVRLARFARVRLLRNALPISLLILRKKKPTVLQSNFPRVRECERSDTFSSFRGSLSLPLSHAETNFKTNVWDQGNSFLDKGNRAACYFKAHEQDLYGENT